MNQAGEEHSAESHSVAGSEQDRLTISRRWLLLKMGIALNAVVGVAITIPVVKYLFAAVKPDREYKSWVSLGPVTNFPVGETRLAKFTNPVRRSWDGETDGVACWVRHVAEREFQVFAINCAHLGCPVRWFPQSQLFLCPCHGGVYYADGSRASGPPERGLFPYEVRLVGDVVQIKAGEMPTLANTAKLVQLGGVKTDASEGDSPCRG